MLARPGRKATHAVLTALDLQLNDRNLTTLPLDLSKIMEFTKQTNQTKRSQTPEKSLFFKILNFAGPIAGFTAALSPLALYFWTCQPQYLPIGASFTTNNQTFQLEVARENKELSKGLKFRSYLPNNQGMLFVINKPEAISLWMKDTHIPLDMIFLKDGEIKHIVRNAPPCTTRECPKYNSVHPVNQVIELPANSVDSLGLNNGKFIKLNIK
ncbi:DUF192 domain-containing protein [Scytonema hofmannii]|nr:DUF192 domain-containing protein [Scytonema hofmannii]